MTSAKRLGRVIGLILVVQMTVAPLVYFRWMTPVTGRTFLETAAGSALQVKVALLLTFLLGVLTFASAIVLMPVIRRGSERMAALFVAMSVVGVATLAFESLAIRNMLNLSEAYARTGAESGVLQTLSGLARSAWVSAHFTNLMVAHGTMFVLYVILFRFRLVPRLITGPGMAGAILSTSAVTATLLGVRFSFLTILPVALCQLALVFWLLARGFEERQPAVAL
jgi:hypothetical protein